MSQRKKRGQRSGPEVLDKEEDALSKKLPDLMATLVDDIIQQQKEVKERIKATREEIEDGARPRRGRFRL